MKRIFISFSLLAISLTAMSQNFNVTFRSNLPYPGQSLANIWGYVDSLGNEYALVGASGGLSIVNVTDPDSPFEVIQIPGPVNDWREIKTWGKYAYVTTEGGGGLQIVDLSKLPDINIPDKFWAPAIGSEQLSSIHALHIDNEYAYLYGSNVGSGGVIIADLSDPWNPVYTGSWEQSYIHDGFVRDDILYAGQIYLGQVGFIDLTDRTNPMLIQTQSTPNNFTHNTWLSDDSKTLFTTDEVDNSFLTAYDITDINNINELDRLQVTPGSGSIVHNTYILNDYAVTSWYKDGFNIVDANRPQNLVQVARYDTYSGSGGGFAGAWGVYPYLPSGTIIVSNINEGLFVLSPIYNRASYLEGMVSDSTCGTPLNNVTVEIVASQFTDVTNTTNLAGEYRTGYHIPGTYDITFSKSGYDTRTITGVILTAGIVTNLDIKLFSSVTVAVSGTVEDSAASQPINGQKVVLVNTNNTYELTTDTSGNFSSCNIVAGTYDMYLAKWGYSAVCTTIVISSSQNNIEVKLSRGYEDDFNFDLGWTVSGNASKGIWERGIPVGTDYFGTGDSNPGVDANDCGDLAFITGNAGGSAGADDVDDGATILTSPVFDLTGYSNPEINYSRWFFNEGGTGTPNDSLVIKLSNGTSIVTLETISYNSPGNSSWLFQNFVVSDHITPTNNMRFIVRTSDAGAGHLVEAGLDNFYISGNLISGTTVINNNSNLIRVSPNPSSGSFNIHYEFNSSYNEGLIVVRDIAGREIDRLNVGTASDVVYGENLKTGIYFIDIVSGKEVSKPLKIIKLK